MVSPKFPLACNDWLRKQSRNKSHDQGISHMIKEQFTWSRKSHMIKEKVTWSRNKLHDEEQVTSHMIKEQVTWPRNKSHDQGTSHMTKEQVTWPGNKAHDQGTSHMITYNKCPKQNKQESKENGFIEGFSKKQGRKEDTWPFQASPTEKFQKQSVGKKRIQSKR